MMTFAAIEQRIATLKKVKTLLQLQITRVRSTELHSMIKHERQRWAQKETCHANDERSSENEDHSFSNN